MSARDCNFSFRQSRGLLKCLNFNVVATVEVSFGLLLIRKGNRGPTVSLRMSY